jgi:hypothetical protein
MFTGELINCCNSANCLITVILMELLLINNCICWKGLYTGKRERKSAVCWDFVVSEWIIMDGWISSANLFSQ